MRIPLFLRRRLVAGALLELLAAGAIVAFAAPLPAAAAEPSPAFQSAARHFAAANAGDAAAATEAADAFRLLLAAAPDDAELLAYTGAATAMTARSAWFPWQKMRLAEDGLALLDRALAQLGPAHEAPGADRVATVLSVKFVAASTFLAMPGHMNRGARAAKLLDEVLTHPLFAAAPLPFRGGAWMLAGKHAAARQRVDEARRWYGQVVAAGAPQAAAATAALQGLAS